MIKGIINGQHLVISAPYVAGETIAKLTADFDFSPEWVGLTAIAYFSDGENTYPFLLTDEGGISADSNLNLADGKWECFVWGFDLTGIDTFDIGDLPQNAVPRLTTDIASFRVHRTGIPGADPVEVEPVSLGEQILAVAGQAKAIAEDIQRRADSGDLKGKDGKDGRDGKDGINGVDGYTPIKGIDYFDGKDGVNGKDGTSVTITGISESTESGGTSVVTFSDGKRLSVKNGRDGQGGSGSDVTKNTVRGWGFAYQDEIPTDDHITELVNVATDLLAQDTTTTNDELADNIINTRFSSIQNRTMRQGGFRTDTGLEMGSGNALYAYRIRSNARYAYMSPVTYCCPKGYLMRVTVYGDATGAGANNNSPYSGVYTGWSRIITQPAAKYCGITIKRVDDGEITPDDFTDCLYRLYEERTTSISADSTDVQVPSALAVKTYVDEVLGGIENGTY